MATQSYAVRPSARRLEPKPHLFLVLSCAHLPHGASRYLLEGVDELRIVRGDSRRFEHGKSAVLSIPDPRISSSHARIRRTPEGYVVDDLGSKNGTFVDEARITTSPLDDGAVLRMGDTILLFRGALLVPSDARTEVTLAPSGSAVATLVPAFAADLDDLVRAAVSDVPILLRGETGTGKEVLARASHDLSGRSGAFVAVNCGALPATLLEATLFGHRRGSFSGAQNDEPGLVRSADGGTLFLDEVAELAPAAQVALLRVLQEKEVLAVGATRPVKVDVRIVSATHRHLEKQIQSGAFRDDLYARLAGFTLPLPALRERREDIGLLAGTLLARRDRGRSATLTPEAGAALVRHPWLRNVRELEKRLSTALSLAGEGAIDVHHLGLGEGEEENDAKGEDQALEERLRAALKVHRGNVSHVATEMKTSRSQVHRWLKRFALDLTRFRK